MNTKKWYSIILTKNQWAKLKPLLLAAKYTFEPSGCDDQIHLSILLNKDGAAHVNDYLRTLMA